MAPRSFAVESTQLEERVLLQTVYFKPPLSTYLNITAMVWKLAMISCQETQPYVLLLHRPPTNTGTDR